MRRSTLRLSQDAAAGPTADLARAVHARRQELGLRQRDLADLAEVAFSTVQGIESGRATVRLDRVLAVLGALGLGLAVGSAHIDPLVRRGVVTGRGEAS